MKIVLLIPKIGNITSRVVTKEEWDILPSNFDPSQEDEDAHGRNTLMKKQYAYILLEDKKVYMVYLM